MERRRPIARWDVERITSDMAQRSWNAQALARAAGVSPKTVNRFLDGTVQTAKTAGKIAAAFGYTTPRRYLSHVEAVA